MFLEGTLAFRAPLGFAAVAASGAVAEAAPTLASISSVVAAVQAGRRHSHSTIRKSLTVTLGLLS